MGTITGSWSIAEVGQPNGKKTYTYTYTAEDDGNAAYTVTVTGLANDGYYLNADYPDGDLPIYLDNGSSPTKVTFASYLLNNADVYLTVTKDDSWSGTEPSLTLEVQGNYTKESDAIATVGDDSWTVTNSGNSGTATYNKYKRDYYTMADESKSITFTEKGAAIPVYELTGLSGVATASEVSSVEGITASNEGTGKEYTVTISKDLVGTENAVTLVDKINDDNENYRKIALAEDGDADDNNNVVGAINGITTTAWGVSSGTATYTQTTTEGWQVNGSTVTHTAEAKNKLLTVTGLSSTATKDDLYFTKDGDRNAYGSVVTLAEDAIGKTDIAITGNSNAVNGAGISYSTFTLAFETAHDIETQPAGFESNGGASYTYRQITTEGFSFAGDNKSATHYDEKIYNFFSLDGISSIEGVDVASESSNGTYQVTLNQSALKNGDVTLTDLNGGSTVADAYAYSLSLASDVQTVTDSASYFNATGDGEATYKYDKSQGWALSAGSNSIVNYIGEVTGISRAVITGLSAGLNNSALEDGIKFDNGTFTLDKSVLSRDVHSPISLSSIDSVSYSLALKDAAGYAVQQSGSSYWKAEGDKGHTKAVYQYDMTEGWSLSGNNLAITYTAESLSNTVAAITGLSAGLTKDQLTTGITVNGKVFTVSDAVLNENSISLEGDGYSLSSTGFAVSKTIDGSGRHWVASGGSATFLYNSEAGYSFASSSSIVYNPVKTTKYFTITGLNNTVDPAALSAAFGASFGEGFNSGTFNFTLSRALLGEGGVSIVDEATTALENDDGISYKLSLADDATIGTVSDATMKASRGNVSITAKIKDYYETVEGGSAIRHVTESDAQTVATIAGINATGSRITGATLSGATILIDRTAFTGASIVIADAYGIHNFSLSFAESANAVGGTSAYLYDDAAWTVDGTTANYQQVVKKGYTLSENGQSIAYSDDAVETAVLMSVTGLSTTTANGNGNVYIDGTTVYLSDNAIGSQSIALDIKGFSSYGIDANAYETYKLAFDNPSKHEIVESDYYSAAKITASGSDDDTVNSTSITYQHYKTEGFSFADDTHANYYGASKVDYFTITGLTEDIGTKASVASIEGITLGESGIITLDRSVLTKHDIQLSNTDYSLAITNAGDWTVKKEDNYFSASESGTSVKVVYQYNKTQGWSVDAGASSITYTPREDEINLFTLEGLNKDLATANNVSVPGNELGGISVSGSGSSYTITLGQAALGSQSVTLTDKTGDGYEYSLTLAEGVQKVTDQDAYFVSTAATEGGKATTTFTYEFDKTQGWEIDDTNRNQINYIGASAGNKLFTLTGLSAGLTATDNPHTFAGISVTALTDSESDDKNYLVTLDENVLGGQSVKLTDNNDKDGINFKLAVTTAVLSVDSMAPYFTISGTTATYQYKNREGWAVDDGASNINYTAESEAHTLFKIEGLTSGLTTTGTPSAIAGISVSGTTVTLDKSVLGANDITFTDENDDKDVYTVALAGDYVTAQSGNYFTGSAASDSTATLKYQYENAYGWSLSGTGVKYTAPSAAVELFTIEGLSYGLSNASGSTATGITVDNDAKTVTLTDEALAGKPVTITGYSFAATQDFTAYAVKDNDSDHWVVSNGSASFLYNNQPGYIRASESSITYTGASTTTFVTITGLSSTVTKDALAAWNASSASVTHIFTLTRDLLGGHDVTLTDNIPGDNIEFNLALDNAATLGTISGESFKASGNDVVLEATLSDYYTLENNSLVKFTSEAQNSTLAKISGLSVANIGSISLSGDTIVLGASALNGTSIALSDNYSGKYALTIDGSKDGWYHVDGDKGWKVAGTKATYQQDTYDGYQIAEGGQSISFDGITVYDTKTFMTIKGIANGAQSIAVSGTSVVLGEDAFDLDDRTNIVLTINDNAYNDYKLYIGDNDAVGHVASESYWTEDGNGNYSFKQDTSKGFEVDATGKKAVYGALTTSTIFTISGLSVGLSEADNEFEYGEHSNRFDDNDAQDKYSSLTGVTIAGTSITLTADALAGKNVTIDKDGYTFALSGVDTPDDLDENLGYSGRYWTKTDDGFVLKYNTGAGYTTDGASVTYVASVSYALATITGLSANIGVGTGDDFGKLGTWEGETFTEITGLDFIEVGLSGTGTITLTSELLGTSDVQITGGSYILAVDNVEEPESHTDQLYWATDNGKVNYQYNIDAGFTLSGDSKTLNYSASTTQAVATFTGLSDAVIAAINEDGITDDLTSYGIEIDDKVFILDEGALNGKNVTLTLGSESAEFAYSLSLATGVAQSALAGTKFEVNNGTAVFKDFEKDYYTLSEKTINYTPATDGTEILTITGLNTAITAADLEGTKYVAPVAAVDDDPETTDVDETVTEVIEQVGTITLGVSAMNQSTITMTVAEDAGKYQFEFKVSDKPYEPNVSDGDWTVTNGTATYSAKVTAGYAISADGKSINYTEANDNKVLVKVTGLSENATKDDIEIENGEILVSKEALGEGNVSISGDNDLGYKLALEDAEGGEDARYYTEEHEANVWRVDGTTATFKRVKLAYYTVDEDKNEIVYHEEEDVDGKTYAVVTGLASALETDDSGNIYAAADENKTNLLEVVNLDGGIDRSYTPDEASLKTISIAAAAITADTEVKITSGDYTFVLNDETPMLPNASNYTWAVDGTTAIYSGDFGEGYDLSSDGKTVTYAEAGTKEIARITGLSDNITVSGGGESLGYLDSDNENTFTEGITETDGVFKVLSDEMLGTSTATIITEYYPVSTVIDETTGDVISSTYTLTLDNGVTQDDIIEMNMWAGENGTFTYREYKPAYYSIGGGSTTIEYTAQAPMGDVLITLTGLNSDVIAVTADSESLLGIMSKDGDGKDVLVPGGIVDDSKKRVTLYATALGTSNITLEGSYTLAKDEGVKTSAEEEYSVDYNGNSGTATVKAGMGAYYTFSTKSVAYNKPGDAATVATITGLASGLTVKQDESDESIICLKTTDDNGDEVNAVEINNSTGKITLSKYAVNGKDISVSGNGGYTLALDSIDNPEEPNTTGDDYGWKIDSSTKTATYGRYTTAGYQLDGDTKLEYVGSTMAQELFTISGLKSVALENGDLKGVKVDNDTVTVTIDKSLLGTSTIELTNSESNTYKLEFDSEQEDCDGVIGFEVEKALTFKSGTAKYAVNTAEGWTLNETDNKIEYTAAASDTAELKGLQTANKFVAYEDETDGEWYIAVKNSDGTYTKYIEFVDPGTVSGDVETEGETEGETETETETGKIRVLKSDILKTGTATLTNGTNNATTYEIELDYAVDEFVDPAELEPFFTKTSKDTKATYGITVAAKSYTTDGEKITYYNKDTNTILATISGLKKDLAAENGEIDGITFAEDSTGDTDGTFFISSDALDHSTKAATVTLGANDNYKLDFGDDLEGAEISGKYWVVKSGTGTYQYTTSKGYTISQDGKTISYTPEGDTTIFTLSGLAKKDSENKNWEIAKPAELPETYVELEGFAITENPTTDNDGNTTTSYVVNLTDINKLGTSKLTLKGDGYTLNVDALAPAPVAVTPEGVKANATSITLKSGTTAGFKAATDGKSATYTKADLKTTFATISGLPKGLAAADIEDGITYDLNSDGGYDITISKDMLDSTTTVSKAIKVKNGKDSSKKEYANTLTYGGAIEPEQKWIVDSKGNATYVDWYSEEGYAVEGMNLNLKAASSYTNNKLKDATTVFKLSGLSGVEATTTTPFDEIGGITVNDEVIYLTKDVLGTSNVKVTGTGYTLSIDGSDIPTEAVPNNVIWTPSDTKTSRKMTLTSGEEAYYSLDAKKTTLKYNKSKTTATLATISGLKLGAEADKDFTLVGTTITLKAGAVDNKNKVTLSTKGDYKLALGEGVTTVGYSNGWKDDSNNSTATWVNKVTTEGYALSTDSKTANYLTTAAATTKLFDLKNATDPKTSVTVGPDGTVNLSAESFGGTKSITLSGTGYKFDEEQITALNKAPKVTTGEEPLTIKSGKLKLTGTNAAGFTYSDANTIAYKAASKSDAELATVSGLNKDLTESSSDFSAEDKTITLAEEELAGATKVTADGKGLIKFDFGEFSGSASVATINGGSSDDTITSAGTNLLISTANGNDLINANGDTVTIDAGAGNDRINVGGDSVSVIGGKGNDSISVTGSDVTINAGVGDDYVDMGSSDATNMFVYEAGDGNDTISHFGDGAISVASGATATAVASDDGDDLIVTITANKKTGTITLVGEGDMTIKKDGSKITLVEVEEESGDVASSPDKLSDDYFDASPQLSEVLGTSYDAVSTDEFGSSYDATQLGKQTVVYGTKK